MDRGCRLALSVALVACVAAARPAARPAADGCAGRRAEAAGGVPLLHGGGGASEACGGVGMATAR